MPSIKSCIATVAFFAFTLAPVAAGPLPGVAARGFDVDSRDVLGAAALARRSRQEVAAAALNKRRAAQKARRAAAAAAGSALKERNHIEARQVAGLATYLNTRCGTTKACQNAGTKPTLGAGASYACSTSSRKCIVTCPSGQALGSDGVSCQSAVTCPSTPPANGYYSGTCAIVCNSGYSLTAGQCLSLSSDPQNCGSVGHVCPNSYNGVGTPKCYNGGCTLSCTGYTYPRNVGTTGLKSCV
ncbi:hypothetical protein T439DRAFT_322434 [Meredithblackwellia eburnea MCA 4105]